MTKADLAAWRDMLVKVRDNVAALAAQKKTLEQIKAAKPTAAFDARWGQGMIKADMVVETVYKALPPAPAKSAAKRKR
jgi:hypothetical protein